MEQMKVSRKNWKWLNSLKEPGDSFDDVLNRLREQRLESTHRTEPKSNYTREDEQNE